MLSKKGLIILAGIVWFAAGINIVRLGILAFLAFSGPILIALAAGSLVIFTLFHTMFSKLVIKNVKRIHAMPGEKALFLHFFNLRSYILMAAMMTFGIWLRTSGIAPDWFIAFFYTGLGCALLLAGIGYCIHSVKGEDWRFHQHSKASL